MWYYIIKKKKEITKSGVVRNMQSAADTDLLMSNNFIQEKASLGAIPAQYI